MANKTDKQNKTDAPKKKRDLTQLKGALRMIVVIAEVYAAALLLLVVDGDYFMKAAAAVLTLDALFELTRRFTR